MAAPILEARDLHKAFASGDRQLAVLRGASLRVATGESVSIRGESGAGKSTLLNLLAGLDAPDSGTVHWQGLAARLRPGVSGGARTRALASLRGIIFQSFYLIPEIDALANVRLAGAICGLPRKEAAARARELLARVGLSERTRHLPAQLSGGERQRVAIARALVAAPPLILADEPTGNLDEHTGDAVVELLLNLCRERQTGLVLVTHNPAHAAKCARQLTLHDGLLA
ncbi:ABC transporter [Cephaloticoccus primus]|uniref:ABC transporter n=1 Tax=Cephaloticoccus primus TaxID=1548207 RepID=A0A139SSD6_9BACT|nr:ABC transporter [Cephaloticoccus primus]